MSKKHAMKAMLLSTVWLIAKDKTKAMSVKVRLAMEVELMEVTLITLWPLIKLE